MTKQLGPRALRNVAARALKGTSVVVALLSAQAIAVEPQYEYRKRVESAQTITALTGDLMGDSVSLYNGATEFAVVDIDLPGNDVLPVQLARRFKIELHPVGRNASFNASLKGAENWDVDVPYIAGTFGGGPWTEERCSVPTTPAAIGFEPTEFWQGTSVHVPGESERTMLLIPAALDVPDRAGLSQWTTREREMFECIPMKSGLPGEGFSMVTTDGLRYDFDVGVSRLQGSMTRTLGAPFSATVTRTRYYLLASRVSDRFGNYVDYTYNADGHPTSIQSSDGRVITMSYAGSRLSEAAAHGRTWTYGYVGEFLSSVALPDGSAWSYDQIGTLSPNQPDWDGNSTSTCSEQPPAIEADYQFSITHPSNALGIFTFSNGRHFRAGVHASACLERVAGSSGGDGGYLYYVLGTPNFYDVVSLRSKSIIGPGVDPLVWTHTYGGSYQPLFGSRTSPPAYPCTNCPDEKTVTVVQPDGSALAYRYGFLYTVNEGRLLGTDTLSSTGDVLRSENNEYLSDSAAQGQPFFPRYGNIINGDDPSTATVRPVVRKTILQQGSSFTWEASSFDVFGRPLAVSKFSDGGGGALRNEVTTYHDDTTRWILGQTASLTVNGMAGSQTTYDGNSMPQSVSEFGQLVRTMNYNPDGTVGSIEDANGAVISLSGWKRGIPQLASFPATPDSPSGTTRAAVVSDQGWITRITDELGTPTNYEYDPLGRLSRIAHPIGDAVAWNDTTLSFTQSSAAAFGLPAGHWRHILSTGNSRRVTYMDALWRPVLVHEYDSEATSTTQRFVRKAFDHAGRQVFTSYPSGSSSAATGAWTEYDALGRVRSSTNDSELGLLTTTTTYQGDAAGFYTLVTSPDGYQTRTWFQAFDEPAYDNPRVVSQPEGALTRIARDVFGKPTSITRSDAASSQSVTRAYVYDLQQRLCKSVEPETGAAIMAYDGVGNMVWSASGSTLTSLASCNLEDVPLAEHTARTYDTLNRVQSIVYPDNLGNAQYSYFADGLLQSVVSDNGGTDVVTNAYSYNNRRLLVGEAIAISDFQWSIGYAFDANGHASGVTLPSGRSVLFAPDGLGQPTQAGEFASGALYFPNGGAKQFTYGNGIVRTQEQNTRGLLERARDAMGSSAVYDESLDYDAHANVAAISDALAGNRSDRTMGYDGLDRLISVTSPMFGTAEFGYNALDNLTGVNVSGGPNVRNHAYTYDATNRLSLVTTASTGTTVAALGYDARGNLASKAGQMFQFDHGNRLRSVTGTESFLYDGHGHRVKAQRDGGGAIYSVYGRDGTLRYQRDERAFKSTEFVHLGSALVAQVETPIALSTPELSVPGYSATGSYTISWTSAPAANRYELQEAFNGGAYVLVHDAAATSLAVSSKGAGEWGYRVRACAQASCGAWSAVRSVTVQLPPAAAPALSVPASGLNGAYTVSWSTVAAAETYELVERPAGGAWVVLANAAVTSRAFDGQPGGSWDYQVRGCNAAGCGAWSAVGSVEVVYPPAGTPLFTAPASNLTGSYTVSWTAVGDALRYELQEQLNSGAWSVIQNSAGVSAAVSGKVTGTWTYQVRACNDAGCAGWSAPASVSVTRPPTGAPVLTLPASSTTGAYTISWSEVTHATGYELQERSGTAAWTALYQGPAAAHTVADRATATWGYQVRACNAAGCGGWSAEASLTVLRAPVTAPTITQNRKRQWYVQGRTEIACDVEWTPVASATNYELQVAGNGLLMYSGPNTAVAGTRSSATYCAPSHQVRACNSSGCSAWSAPPTPQQLVEFGDPGNPGVEP